MDQLKLNVSILHKQLFTSLPFICTFAQRLYTAHFINDDIDNLGGGC